MNVVNRLLALVFLLLLLALAVGTAGIVSDLLPVSAVDRVHFYGPLHQALTDLGHLRPMGSQIIVAGGAVLAALLSLVLLALELRPPRRERTLTLTEDQEGRVAIDYAAVRGAAERASLDVAGVEGARCRVGTRKGQLRLSCRVTVGPFAPASAIGVAVESAVRDRLQEMLAQPVEQVQVQVDLQKIGGPTRVR